MTLTADARGRSTHAAARPGDPAATRTPPAVSFDERPVEFWPTAEIRSALESGDLAVWQRIVVAIKRDPYGRTSRQVEEVLESSQPYGVSRALDEVLERTRAHLEANERAEIARHVRKLLDRSGLGQQEFASRIGVPADALGTYLDGEVSPPASLMIRMRKLSDRFSKMHSQRSNTAD